jgi:hypothetical protein
VVVQIRPSKVNKKVLSYSRPLFWRDTNHIGILKASAKRGTGVCARGACTSLAVDGGNYCTKHKQELDENSAKVRITQLEKRLHMRTLSLSFGQWR